MSCVAHISQAGVAWKAGIDLGHVVRQFPATFRECFEGDSVRNVPDDDGDVGAVVPQPHQGVGLGLSGKVRVSQSEVSQLVTLTVRL